MIFQRKCVEILLGNGISLRIACWYLNLENKNTRTRVFIDKHKGNLNRTVKLITSMGYLIIIARARVAYEMLCTSLAVNISYLISASKIIVLLKPPPQYGELKLSARLPYV